ncbi:HET-domain-containing protein [Podospora conica]|nr:HET-domain-containing protein [Schizothecium conicum]
MSPTGRLPYPLSRPVAQLNDGWFRLVDLEPGPRDSPLRCTISSHPLSDAPKYEALSYAWGDANDVANHVEISLNGHPFGITPELEKALLQLRNAQSPRTMWIDWICINQSDLGERNHQVARMRDIYRTAERVVAWIGDESEDSDRAMMFLREMAIAKKRGLCSTWQSGRRVGSDTSSECGGGTPDRQVETLDEPGQERAGEEEAWSSSESGSSSSSEEEEVRVGQTQGLSDVDAGVDLSPEQPLEERDLEGSQGSDVQPVESEQELTEENTEEDRTKQEATEKRWDEYTQEWERNWELRSHLVVGVPILHYEFGNTYDEFFKNSRLEDWEALDRLFERPWWSRTWVVQEIWISTSAILQCGRTTLKWKTLQKAMDYSEAWDDMGYRVQNTLRSKSWGALKRRYGLAIHIAKQRLLGWARLSDLLWNTWDREATDPRDKVFALVGLLGREQDDTLPPPTADYTKPMDQVYRETAKYIVNSKNSLDILLAASGLDGEASGLPSWVPDWRRSGNDQRPALFINASRMQPLAYFSGSTEAVFLHGHGYSASGDSKMEVRFSDDLRTVYVRGFLFDSVSDVGPRHDESSSITDIVNGARSVLAKLSSSGVERTEIAERELKTVLRAGSYIERDDEFFRSEDQVVKNVMCKRRFFVTRNGHLCIGPARTDVGDLVYYMAGCNFPMVLRSNGKHLTLVGEAYVHKYMAGEALERTPYGPPEWSELAIC